MIWPALLLAVHALGAVIWVGGMFFALLVLRPSMRLLEPPQRLALHAEVLRRFFRLVWHVMPLILLSGYAMLFLVYGGFRYVGWNVHVMHLFGLIMAAVFGYIVFVPWRGLGLAIAASNPAAAAASVERIRILITVNLALGLATVAVAAF